MDPIKIGWLGACLDGRGGGYDKIHRMAFDEAVDAGLLDRPYEFVLHAENGLPNGSAKNATDGFRYLVDEGCIGVAGAYSSDNAITVAPLANELQVPLISWAGTERLQGDYCFRLGNGDVGGDAALVVAWLERQGHQRVAVLSEISPNGEEYFRFFRQECRRRGITIAAVETVSQTPEHLADNLDNLRQVDADALVYMGYGMLAAKGLLREALDELAWDPPRIMGTAFMFYLMGFDKFEGWVGIDQLDPRNPLVDGFHERFVAALRQSRPMMWPNAIPVLAYDTARVLVEGLFRAPILSGPGLKAGPRAHPLHAEHHRRHPHPHRLLAVRARDVPRRLAALRPRHERQARVRRSLRTLGVTSPSNTATPLSGPLASTRGSSRRGQPPTVTLPHQAPITTPSLGGSDRIDRHLGACSTTGSDGDLNASGLLRRSPLTAGLKDCAQTGMYEGAGFVKGAGPVLAVGCVVTAGVGARATDRCRLSGWVVARALRAFPSVRSPGRDDQGWQARLPRHVFAAVVRMMGSRATAMSGSISSTTRSRRLGSCRSSNSRQGRVRVSRGCLDGLGEASDLAVAEPVVGEGENLAGDRDARLVHTAPLRDLAVAVLEDVAAVVAADPFDERPAQQPRSLLGDLAAPVSDSGAWV